MASDQVDTSDVVDFSVFRVELPRLNPYAQDVYGCLLNNRMYMFQPNCKMDLPLVKAALGCYYPTVHSVYIQSPQVAFLDICIGKSSPVQAFDSISTLEFTEQPFLRILCLTVMWFSVLWVNLFVQIKSILWLLLLLSRRNCQAWICSISTGIWNGIIWLGLSYLICPQEMS